MINKVILIGNLGRDPEVRRLENGATVAKITIATNESYKDRNSGEWVTLTEWHNVVLWRALAERAENQLKKGAQVYLEGKLTHRKYQDQDGKDRYITEVVANTFRLLGRREDSSSAEGYFPAADSQYSNSSGANTNTAAPVTPASENKDANPTDQADDDLPF